MLTALESIFIKNEHAEKVVDYYLKFEKKWGARDRRQFAQIVYDIVRDWRFLLSCLGEISASGIELESFAARFAEDKSIMHKVVQTYLELREDPKKNNELKSSKPIAVAESLPDWLYEYWFKEYLAGDAKGSQQEQQFHTLIKKLNLRAKQYLRVNTLKISREDLQKKLTFLGIETDFVAGVESALVLRERKNVFTTELFKNGYFEMQDAGSQLIAPLLGVQPGARVIDACAGAGGKTLQLAELMKNKGQIIALDIHQWKLDELKKRARRAGISIIETRLIDSTKVIKRLGESCDYLLLDVPCSGLGVLRRHPDTKWKLTLSELNELTTLQADLLLRYSQMLRAGGQMVYATCSLLPAENEKQVAAFLKQTKFKLAQELKLDPTENDFDGFYAARLVY